ncbi:1-deoxy-D-xylulose-5-phosphate synthase [bacterium]|nr:1-deoxy-D-xylulose-5-phosphate synthase [bacterium]
MNGTGIHNAQAQSYGLLDAINEPGDLRRMREEQLPEVCAAVRRFLINHVAQTGGHFASNLGVVELAVALHYVFDTPRDELVWDTGHQAYPHKILTGRKGQFTTMRKYRGLCGFPTPEESPYDAFPVGHAGTSISVALGIAKARDLQKKDNHVVAIIGDGGLTCGLALEALNNAHGTPRFLVVLNDNEMSISPTIGALARHFSRLVSNPRYRRIKHGIGSALDRTPGIGHRLTELVMRLMGAAKHLLVPQNVFEHMGFHYLGPIDGHNVHELVTLLHSCRLEADMPVLLHVITKKGKGFEPAERDPAKFHGVTPFNKDTGEANAPAAGATYTRLFARALMDEARVNERIMVISAAMVGGTGMDAFAQQYPQRFIDVGIAEQHAVTYAGGLAARGERPVVTIYSSFLQRAYDEILHDVCVPRAPVILAIDRAGLVGDDGKTHHGIFDIAYLRHMPGMNIFMPRDETAMRRVLHHALERDAPCAIRYPRGVPPAHVAPPGLPPFAQENPERWDVLKPGADVSIIALGHMVFYAWRAAELLAEGGVRAAVVDACAIQPLDKDTLWGLAAGCTRFVTIEDHVLSGGFGSAVAEWITAEGIAAHLLRIGIPDSFIEHGSLEELYSLLKWQPDQLAHRIARWVSSTGWHEGGIR